MKSYPTWTKVICESFPKPFHHSSSSDVLWIQIFSQPVLSHYTSLCGWYIISICIHVIPLSCYGFLQFIPKKTNALRPFLWAAGWAKGQSRRPRIIVSTSVREQTCEQKFWSPRKFGEHVWKIPCFRKYTVKKKVSFDIWFWAGLWIQHFETKAVAIHTRKLRPCQFKQTTHREQPRLKFKRRPCNFGLNKFEVRQKLQDVYSVFSGKMMDDGWNF